MVSLVRVDGRWSALNEMLGVTMALREAASPNVSPTKGASPSKRPRNRHGYAVSTVHGFEAKMLARSFEVKMDQEATLLI